LMRDITCPWLRIIETMTATKATTMPTGVTFRAPD
jgi:hypothetical protein